MPDARMKHSWVVHKSTAGSLKPIPEAVDLVGNPRTGLTSNTVPLLQQRGTANHLVQLRSARTPRGMYRAAESI
jgi:hypothetical protein